jgi:uncharacterized protein YqkB
LSKGKLCQTFKSVTNKAETKSGEKGTSTIKISSRNYLSLHSNVFFHAGLYLHVRNANGMFFPAQVVQVKSGKILVNYIGWNSDFDEWITSESNRLVVYEDKQDSKNCAGNGISTNRNFFKEVVLISDENDFYFPGRIRLMNGNQFRVQYQSWCKLKDEIISDRMYRIYVPWLEKYISELDPTEYYSKISLNSSTESSSKSSDQSSIYKKIDTTPLSIQKFAPNMNIYVLDCNGMPTDAYIVKCTRAKILVRYFEQRKKSDEWIPTNSKRIRIAKGSNGFLQKQDLINLNDSSSTLMCHQCSKILNQFRYILHLNLVYIAYIVNLIVA